MARAPLTPDRTVGRTARAALAATAVVVAGLTAIAAGVGVAPLAAGATDRPPRARRTVRVTERDFHIRAPRSLPSGRLRVRVHNAGPDDHELIVVRDDGSGALPLRADGLTVDEGRIAARTVAGIEPSPPYGSRTLDVRLPPGRYELFCNMSGHYLGGMHRRLTVR